MMFFSQLNSTFQPRRPRHPLARALSLIVGVAVLGLTLLFGLFVAAVLLAGGALVMALRRWNRRRAPSPMGAATRAHRPEVLEGEFVVLNQTSSAAR